MVVQDDPCPPIAPPADPIARVLAVLDGIADHGHGQYGARCPAHDDATASLSVAAGQDGRALLYCHAGCTAKAIVAAIGLKLVDLYPTWGARHGAPRSTLAPRLRRVDVEENQPLLVATGLTLAELAAAKQLPIELLRRFGLRDFLLGDLPVVRIPHHDEDGTVVAVQFRRLLTSGPGKFVWRRGDTPALFGVKQLVQARRHGPVESLVLVEGASDVLTLEHIGVVTLGLPSAAHFASEWDSALDGIARIEVIIEGDTGGQAVCRWLRNVSWRTRAWMVRLPAKDVSELYLVDPSGFVAAFQAARDLAVPVHPTWPNAASVTIAARRR